MMISMIILDLKKAMTGLDGKPLLENNKELSFGKVISIQLAGLAGLSNEESIRAYRYAADMYDKDQIEVDDDKLDFITKMMEKTQQGPLIKGQLILFLQSYKNNK